MTEFVEDHAVDDLQPAENSEDLVRLLKLLAGRAHHELDSAEVRDLADHVREAVGETTEDELSNLTKVGHAQLNELLLLVGEPRVREPFFSYFAQPDLPDDSDSPATVPLEKLKDLAVRFRGYALLGFGNFRFGFNHFREATSESELLDTPTLKHWVGNSESAEEEFRQRPRPLAPISEKGTRIAREDTPYIGYLMEGEILADRTLIEMISARKEGQDLNELRSELEAAGSDAVAKQVAERWPPDDELIREFGDQIEELKEEAESIQEKWAETRGDGRENTERYLTWDYMDVYVATSMRNSWEYEETYDVIDTVFGRRTLQELRVRHFDPTQSYEDGIYDKGLIEALMLKRATCTVYMAQEADTLGKDSELAATLAQGKPVIAYVPKVTGEEKLKDLADTLRKRPITYFRQRLNDLMAEAFLRDEGACNRILAHLDDLDVGRFSTPGELVQECRRMRVKLAEIEDERKLQVLGDQARFRKKFFDEFEDAPEVMAAIEADAMRKRARTIRQFHPLAMQVHLESGVANGVLVARSEDQVAKLIQRLLTKRMKFRIATLPPSSEEPDPKRRRAVILEEAETGSRFRLMTANESLTNSFWNFYLR